MRGQIYVHEGEVVKMHVRAVTLLCMTVAGMVAVCLTPETAISSRRDNVGDDCGLNLGHGDACLIGGDDGAGGAGQGGERGHTGRTA